MYVDDIIVIGSTTSLIVQVISILQSTFALKDLEELNYLGIQVTKNAASLLFLSLNMLMIYLLK